MSGIVKNPKERLQIFCCSNLNPWHRLNQHWWCMALKSSNPIWCGSHVNLWCCLIRSSWPSQYLLSFESEARSLCGAAHPHAAPPFPCPIAAKPQCPCWQCLHLASFSPWMNHNPTTMRLLAPRTTIVQRHPNFTAILAAFSHADLAACLSLRTPNHYAWSCSVPQARALASPPWGLPNLPVTRLSTSRRIILKRTVILGLSHFPRPILI